MGRHRDRESFPFFFFQAAGASDPAAARVIFVILSIVLILSPAVSRTGRDADPRDDAPREERQEAKDRMDSINRMTKMPYAATPSLAPAA